MVYRVRAAPIARLTRWSALAFSMLIALMVSGFATAPKIVSHAFGFNTPQDSPQYEVLAYKYGDGEVVTTSSDSAIRQFGVSKQGTNVNGPMALGDALTVKWRDRTTGKTYEDEVDLRPLLPDDMTRQRIHFAVNGDQLFIFLIDPVPRPKDWQVVGPRKFQYEKVRQIYPGNGADSKGRPAMAGSAWVPPTGAQILPGKFVFFAAFDDESNFKESPAFAAHPQRSPVGQMYERYDSSRPGGYYPGPSTPDPLWNAKSNGGVVTEEMRMTADSAYNDFVREAREWLAEDPSRSPKDISIFTKDSGRSVPTAGVQPSAGGVKIERGLR